MLTLALAVKTLELLIMYEFLIIQLLQDSDGEELLDSSLDLMSVEALTFLEDQGELVFDLDGFRCLTSSGAYSP